MDHEVNRWSNYWGTESSDTCTLVWEAEALPRGLSWQELRDTAKSFPAHTSARDGLHPRAIGLLSQEALEGLALVFKGVEVVGDFPASLKQVLIRLIPKPASTDTRPFSLFR